MKAEDLQKMFNRLEMPDFRDQDAFHQYLFLQIWVSMAVSAERIAQALTTWEKALLGEEKPIKENDSPYRLG